MTQFLVLLFFGLGAVSFYMTASHFRDQLLNELLKDHRKVLPIIYSLTICTGFACLSAISAIAFFSAL